MQSVTTFAIPEGLHIESLVFEESGVTILASSKEQAGQCPKCGRSSRRIRGHYRRTVADLPWAGVPVRFRVRVRKFQCENPRCQRKIFAERLEGLARCYARRTDRQREALEEVGFALGGEAGSRLAANLGLPASPDTILRYLGSLPDGEHRKVRVLGIDDWSWRKRVRYGTILVDLERHRVVELLPDREGQSLVAWLEQHPEVEVITRDRSDTYREAAKKGAPQAVQVVDRWHILKNLISYLERCLLHHKPALKEAAPLLRGLVAVEMPPD